MNKARAIFRLLGLLVVTLGATTYMLLRLPLASAARRDLLAAAIAQAWARALVRVLGVHIEARGEVPPSGSLIVANHRGYADIVALLVFAPAIFLAKEEVRSWPVLGWGARCGRTLFVDREDKASRRRARAALREVLGRGASCVVFPEGTTAPKPEITEFQPGSFAMAAEAEVPVAPVAVEYESTHHCWLGDDEFLPHFLGTFGEPRVVVRLRFGPVARSSCPVALKRHAEQFIHGAVAAMNEEQCEAQGHRVRPRPTQGDFSPLPALSPPTASQSSSAEMASGPVAPVVSRVATPGSA